MTSLQEHPAFIFLAFYVSNGELKSMLSGVTSVRPFLADRKTESQQNDAAFISHTGSVGSIHVSVMCTAPASYPGTGEEALAAHSIGIFQWGSLSLGFCQVIHFPCISDQPDP